MVEYIVLRYPVVYRDSELNIVVDNPERTKYSIGFKNETVAELSLSNLREISLSQNRERSGRILEGLVSSKNADRMFSGGDLNWDSLTSAVMRVYIEERTRLKKELRALE